MAAETALFIGWGAVQTGRERDAIKVFDEAVQYYGSLQQQGQIESFEPYALEPHGGDLWGFILLHGDLDKLNQVRYSEEFVRILDRAITVVNNPGIITAFTGQRLQTQFQTNQQNITDIVER